MVVSLMVGLVLVVLMLWVFVRRDGWADVGESVDSVEHAHLRRVAEAGISSLAPGAMRLAESERAGIVSGTGAATAAEFWRRFAAASAGIERDPAAVLEELRELPGVLEEALRFAERQAAAMAGDSPRREDGR